jgi:hypothetical protein
MDAQTKSVYTRVNGRGNAWPVFLGSTHPFYNIDDLRDMANASYSIMGTETEDYSTSHISWEILIDSGHLSVQYLLQHGNRIPEAVVLTHPHMDHTLGVDWVAQSYYRQNDKKKYPLYATLPCWEYVKNSYPQLEPVIEFHEIKYGVRLAIRQVKDLYITPFPVFHGESGFGASMILFEYINGGKPAKVVFTGDMLCPLLRREDYEKISDASVMYIDSNNRFPYPRCNHESFVKYGPGSMEESNFLISWKEEAYLSYLLAPHSRLKFDRDIHGYIDTFLKEHNDIHSLTFSIIEFIKELKVPEVKLIHFSGMEDEKYHGQEIMNERQLENWANSIASKENLATLFSVPKSGDIFRIV